MEETIATSVSTIPANNEVNTEIEDGNTSAETPLPIKIGVVFSTASFIFAVVLVIAFAIVFIFALLPDSALNGMAAFANNVLAVCMFMIPAVASPALASTAIISLICWCISKAKKYPKEQSSACHPLWMVVFLALSAASVALMYSTVMYAMA